MEHPNLSFRLNNVENSFNQPSAFDSLKKNLNGTNDYSADSGYLTNSSINQTEGSSIRLYSLSSTSFKRSVDLAPINELQEFDCTESSQQSFAANETPTTKSIRQLSAFHINTPPLSRSETTPTKGNYFAQELRSDRSHSSRKKNRQRLYSPYEADGKLSLSRERRNLFDTNNENEFASNVHDVSIGFSPIGTYDGASAKMSPVKIHQIQRHPSGIESSTPKKGALRRIQTQAIVKPDNSTVEIHANRLIRKTQSLNPNKMVLRESNASNMIVQHGSSSNEPNYSILAHNPAIAMLKLSNEQFDQLIDHRFSTDMKTPTKQQKAAGVKTARQSPLLASPSSNKSHFKAKHRSRLFSEFSQKRSLRSLAATKSSTKLADSLNESDILMALTDASNEEPSPILPPVAHANADLDGSKTPKVNCFMATAKSGTPHRDNSMTHSLQVEANRTPTKRFNRSVSFNPSQRQYNPEKENKKYDRLPCTPPKNYIRRTVKRPANTSIDSSPATPPPSAKRKLYRNVEQRTHFYHKCRQIDILMHLHNFNLTNVITHIFNYLDERDLQTVRSTSKSWSEAIMKDPIHDPRRSDFLSKCQRTKENARRSLKHSRSMNITNNNNDSSVLLEKRKPFNMSNDTNSIIERPEPVSPSTRKFRENQKVCVLSVSNGHFSF